MISTLDENYLQEQKNLLIDLQNSAKFFNKALKDKKLDVSLFKIKVTGRRCYGDKYSRVWYYWTNAYYGEEKLAISFDPYTSGLNTLHLKLIKLSSLNAAKAFKLKEISC